MTTTVKPKWDGIREFLWAPDTVRRIATIADEVAQRAAAATGAVDGHPVPTVAHGEYDTDIPRMRREDDPTDERARSAVIGQHPTADGRKAASDALRAALGTHYNGGLL